MLCRCPLRNFFPACDVHKHQRRLVAVEHDPACRRAEERHVLVAENIVFDVKGCTAITPLHAFAESPSS